MAENNIVQKIKRWKLMSKRPIGRPKDWRFGRRKAQKHRQLGESSAEWR
jgi:hypothetical protein